MYCSIVICGGYERNSGSIGNSRSNQSLFSAELLINFLCPKFQAEFTERLAPDVHLIRFDQRDDIKHIPQFTPWRVSCSVELERKEMFKARNPGGDSLDTAFDRSIPHFSKRSGI